MKKSISKYIVSFCAVVALFASPVFGAQLSGAQLLERFDELFVSGIFFTPAETSAFPAELDEPDAGPALFYNYDPAIIIIIEEDAVYEAAFYGGVDHGFYYGTEFAAAATERPEWSVRPVDGFSIASGINRRSESTFDTARTIVGTAPRGAVIRIEVYGYNESSGAFYMVSGSVQTVGASGSFSSAQQLNLGHNFILIKATYSGGPSDASFVSIETAQLNRLPDEVRNQLERGLLLP